MLHATDILGEARGQKDWMPRYSPIFLDSTTGHSHIRVTLQGKTLGTLIQMRGKRAWEVSQDIVDALGRRFKIQVTRNPQPSLGWVTRNVSVDKIKASLNRRLISHGAMLARNKGIREEQPKPVTKSFKITASPDVIQTFE